jgi:dienelactone hydrolase
MRRAVVQRETLRYEADVPMAGILYRPERTEPRPGVLVFSDIFGLGDHARERAARLAEQGYVALAADLHGGGQILAFEPAMQQLAKFQANPHIACERGDAALARLRDVPGVDATRVAAIGFCYGGTLALEMARRGAVLSAVVGFHSGLATSNPNGAALIKGKVLACVGSEDPAVPAAQRAAFEAEMRASPIDWQLHVYGGVYHTFTDRRCDAWGKPDFARYSAAADRCSWTSMRALLDEAFDVGNSANG